MFIEQVKKDWIANCHAVAAHKNESAAEEYIGACRNWAARRQQGVEAAGPEPIPAIAVEPVIDLEGLWSVEFKPTGKPVSDIPPTKFLPTFKTDENAIGFPIGGPILNEHGDPTGRYYDFSSAASSVGRKVTINGKKYKFDGLTPFNRFWVEDK